MKDKELKVTVGAFKRIFPKLCTRPENMEFEPTGNPYEVIVHYKDKSINDIRFQYHDHFDYELEVVDEQK